MTPVLRTDRGVTLVGGGALNAGTLRAAMALAPVVMAADGGADAALALGVMPDAVVGDFDSLSDAARAAVPADRLHHIAEQDSTDLQKCLSRVEAPFVIVVGFDGARVDHTLAALTVLIRRPGPPCVMLSPDDAIIPAPTRLTLDLPPGTRVSLFPMGEMRGRSTGLRWPIDGLVLTPAGQVSTSNEATGRVTLDIEGPGLVIVPAAHLAQLLAAIAG